MKLFYNYWNKIELPLDQDTPKLVLLHGMGGTGSLWRPIAAALEEKMALLAPDQRGHGKSIISISDDASAQYAPLNYGQDVIDTLESLRFYPTWILGHSMGVRTAVAAAYLRPQSVQGLILIDLGLSGLAGGGLGDGLGQFLKSLPMTFNTREEARNYMSQHCPDPAIVQYLLAVSAKTSDGKLTFPFDRSALVETIEESKEVSLRDWIKELAKGGMPIRILRGQNSLVWSHEEFEKEKKDFSKFKSVIFDEVANAGHGLPFEQRAFLIQLLEKLILKS